MSVINHIIERGIPLPTSVRRSRGKWQVLSSKMQIGDSVLLGHADAKIFSTTLRKSNFQPFTRKENRDFTRVWKGQELAK